jgi:hypothetical protein
MPFAYATQLFGRISKATHAKDWARAIANTDITSKKKTHLGRAMGPNRLRLMYNASLSEIAAMGLWEKTVLTTAYSSLPGADIVANAADILNRAWYYLTRMDLHPRDFPRFAAMLADSPFAVAHELKLLMMVGVLTFQAYRVSAGTETLTLADCGPTRISTPV